MEVLVVFSKSVVFSKLVVFYQLVDVGETKRRRLALRGSTHSLSCAGNRAGEYTCCAHNADRGLRNEAHRLYPRYLDHEQGRFAP